MSIRPLLRLPSRLPLLLAVFALLPALALAHGPAPGGVRQSHSYVRHSQPYSHSYVRPHSSVNFGVSIGSGYYYPGYYPNYWYGPPVIYSPPVYSAPPVVIQTQPPVYIERPVETAEAPASSFWYYCASSKSYYPYVSECAEAWQRVPPAPPAPASAPATPAAPR